MEHVDLFLAAWTKLENVVAGAPMSVDCYLSLHIYIFTFVGQVVHVGDLP